MESFWEWSTLIIETIPPCVFPIENPCPLWPGLLDKPDSSFSQLVQENRKSDEFTGCREISPAAKWTGKWLTLHNRFFASLKVEPLLIIGILPFGENAESPTGKWEDWDTLSSWDLDEDRQVFSSQAVDRERAGQLTCGRSEVAVAVWSAHLVEAAQKL